MLIIWCTLQIYIFVQLVLTLLAMTWCNCLILDLFNCRCYLYQTYHSFGYYFVLILIGELYRFVKSSS